MIKKAQRQLQNVLFVYFESSYVLFVACSLFVVMI